MIERERLEKEILEIGERERRRIGRDLHDSLCQHLTGTALAGQVLEKNSPQSRSPNPPTPARSSNSWKAASRSRAIWRGAFTRWRWTRRD